MTYTAKQVAEAAKDALENWDFDVMLEDNGGDYSEKYVSSFKEALNFDQDYASEVWPDGIELKSERDIWDILEEFAHNMAS